MSDVVFILGAGASRQGGAPLMADFLDVAQRLFDGGRLPAEATDSFRCVFQGVEALQSVHFKAELDIRNIESVFAAFEMASVLEKLPRHAAHQIDKFSNAMRDVIVHTIEQTLLFPFRQDTFWPPGPYDAFGELVKYLLNDAHPKQSVSVITFNYDVAADRALSYLGLGPLYGLASEKGVPGVPLLKLHGSLNWRYCPECKNVVAWSFKDFMRGRTFIGERAALPLCMGSKIGEFKHCGAAVAEAPPAIVPPTWRKQDFGGALASVWRRAAAELTDAKHIIVIGYSLPASDAFFRYLYALGTCDGPPLRSFWVVDPDESGAVKDRFTELLGSAGKARFKYWELRFSEIIKQVRVAFPGRDNE